MQQVMIDNEQDPEEWEDLAVDHKAGKCAMTSSLRSADRNSPAMTDRNRKLIANSSMRE